MINGQKVYHSLYGSIGAAKMIASGFFGMEAGHQGLPYLRDLSEVLEFGIISTEGGQDGNVKMEAELYTGTNTQLLRIVTTGQGTQENFNNLPAPLERISNPKAYEFVVKSDLFPTVSLDGVINPGDTRVTVPVNLDLSGRVYALAVPVVEGGTDTNYNVVGGARYEPKLERDGALVPLSQIPQGLRNETRELWLHENHPKTDLISHPPTNLPSQVGRGNTAEQLTNGGGSCDVIIPSLTPSTQYILYLVSTDVAGNPAEKALCYKFTTLPPKPPAITINPGGTTAEIHFRTPDNNHDPMNSLMASVLVRLDYFTLRPNNPFSQPMRNYLDPSKTLPTSFPADGTVLQAMWSEDGLSVFDNCASSSAKSTFFTIITSTYNQTFYIDEPYYHEPSTVNDLENSARSYTDKDLTFNLTDGNEYALLMVAKGENSEVYGFRASWPYQNAQPKYLTVTAPRLVNENLLNPDLFTGTVYLTFNDPLRYRERTISSGSTLPRRLPIDTCEVGHGLHVQDTENRVGDNGATNLWFVTFGTGVRLTNLNPTTNTAGHGSIIDQSISLRLTEVQEGTMLVDFGDRIIGATTVVRPGTNQLMISLARDANGNWILDYNGVDWS